MVVYEIFLKYYNSWIVFSFQTRSQNSVKFRQGEDSEYSSNTDISNRYILYYCGQ